MSEDKLAALAEEIQLQDQTDVAKLRVKDLFQELGLKKVSYRQSSLGDATYKVEVVPHADFKVCGVEQDKLTVACRELATEWFFNLYIGVQGVIWLSDDGDIRWCGDKLEWSPLYLDDV